MSWLSNSSNQATSSNRPTKNPLAPSRRFNSNEPEKQQMATKMQIDVIAPTFQKKPSIRHEEEGKKLVFETLIEAEPKPFVKWSHNGQLLQENPRYKFDLLNQGGSVYKASLEITNITIDLSGTYTINASNQHGEANAKIALNFDSEQQAAPIDGCKPIFLERPVIKQSSDFKQVQFDCRLQADPKPTIQWLHKGEPIEQTAKIETILIPVQPSSTLSSSSTATATPRIDKDKKEYQNYIASLVLKGVEQERTGDYRCVATNKHGSGFASISLNLVQGKSKIPDGKAPKFPIKPSIKQIGSSLHIECVVEAKPKPQITWFHDQKSIIKEDSKHSHLSWNVRGPITSDIELANLGVLDGDDAFPASNRSSFSSQKSTTTTKSIREIYVVSLEIKHPKASDGGTYRCNAINELGESSANIALNFQQKLEDNKEEQEEKSNKIIKSKKDDDIKMESENNQNTLNAQQEEAIKQEKRSLDEIKRKGSNDVDSNERKLSTSSFKSNVKNVESSEHKQQQQKDEAMEVDTISNTNPIKSLEQQRLSANEDSKLEQLAPAKRTSSTSSIKRTTSVKKKRPSLLEAPNSLENHQDQDEVGSVKDEGGNGLEVPKKRIIKKRVSVKKNPNDSKSKLEEISENFALKEVGKEEARRKSSASGSVDGNKELENRRESSTNLKVDPKIQANRSARIPSVSVESASGGQQQQQQQQLKAPKFSVSEPKTEEPNNQRRGTYDNLRAQPSDGEEDLEAEDQKRRYLATRGGQADQPRDSLSPVNQREGSISPQRQGSVERRGSLLLAPDAGDLRRPSIILAGDNKLRPGEIADRRRRSSIDVRRASAIEVEAADRPSTPLRPCGKKPAILDFQDNVSGTENHTSYLTFGIEGDPIPTLRFFKGDSEIYEGGRYSIVTDGETNTVHFCIRKSKPIDEARYKVTATNEHGEDTAYMQLFVSDESGMDFRAMLRHRQYAKWKKDQDDPNWGNLKSVEEERLAQIKEPKRPDNFIKPLQNQKVKQGKDLKVRFECVFSKSGVKAKWFRNNKEIFPNKKFHLNSTGDLHVLEIEGPYVEDSGKFTCQCLDTKCSAMLEVEEPDPIYKFTKLLAKGYGQHLNRELILECTCNSFRAQVNWFKNDPECKGEPIKILNDTQTNNNNKYSFELDKFGKKILRIRNCQFDDSGTYTCKIINTPKIDEVTTTSVQITEKKFQIMKPLYSQRATEDDKIVLECEVDEYDAPVKWYRKDRETGKWKELKPEQLKHKEIIVDGKKRRLIIKKAKCQDEGEYKCCTNADETACELFVEPSNKWRKKLNDVTIIEDEQLVLEVELMERKPGVALIWYRNNKEVGCQGGAMQTTADERINFKTTDEQKLQLIIEHARLTDAGDWSVLFNKMKCSCKVNVLPGEKVPSMRFPFDKISCEVGKPQTIEIPYQVNGTKQSPIEAKLLCNGQLVPKDKVDIIVKDDKVLLKFKDPKRNDANENYEFVLENAKGKQAQKFKLDVQGPPGTPEGPLKISDIFKDKCKLQWEKPLDDGGSPIAHYIVERQEVGSGRTTWTECGITSTCELDVNDLSPKKEYKFRVRAVNKKGKSEPLVANKSIIAKDPYDPPSEPENVTVANWDKDFVDLEWEAPMNDGGIPIEKYIIESKSKFGQDWNPIKEVPAENGCKAHITETLKEGAQLQFRVRAANKMGTGEPSKASKPVTVKARFVRPYIAGDGLKNIVVKKGRPIRYEVNFKAEPAAEVSWLMNGEPLKVITDKCEIDSNNQRTIIQITNTTRADSGRYKLVLTNSCGQCVSEADVVVLDRPSAPEGPLVIEEIKSDQVTMKWRKPKDTGGEDIEGYVVEKMNLETGRWVPAGECGPKEEMFTVKNLMKGKKYKFRIRAKNKEGESDALETGNVVSVGEEPTVVKCPSLVNVAKGATAKVKVFFQGEPSEFKVVNVDTGAVLHETGDGVGGDKGPKFTVFDDYLTVTIPDADKDRDSGNYRVEFKNKIGSAEANFKLGVTGPPGAPQGPLDISDINENSATLNWRPPNDDGGAKVTHYVVERRDISQAGDSWIEVNAQCKDTNFTVTGLTSGQKYEFRVMAANESGLSVPLVSDMPVVAKPPYEVPSPPGQPEATPLADGAVQLDWARPSSDGGSRLTGYIVEKREVGSDTWQRVNGGQPCLTNELTVKNLIEGRKYEFRVMALNAAGQSEPSECSAATLIKDPNATDVPKFVKGLKKTTCVDGGQFELECVVQGNPSPSVVWMKGNKELRDGTGKYCITQESGPDGTTIHRLLVTRADASNDADEYSIKATNKAGSRTSRAEVDIQTKPKIQIPARLAGEAPIAFDRGETIQLRVPFTGNPSPTARWFKGDEEIEPNAQFDIDSDGRHATLTIRDATREDSGDYRLVVSNPLGEDSANFTIAVADRPEPPKGLKIVGNPGDESVKLQWEAPLWDGGSQITQYVIEKRELPMTSWIRAGTTRFLNHEIENLNDNKEYEFRVFAENIYGRSDPCETVKCKTQDSGKKRQRIEWPLDADGKKIRTTNTDENLPIDNYDKFVRDGPAVHMAADIKTCPITDNYEILERIGEGVFGEVYRVKEKSTGDYYAAKFTPTNNHEEKSLLRKEIDVINMLHHKNTLRLHDAYEDEDEIITVHEFISGPEILERACEPGYQMSEEQVRKYMRDICEAVCHMHDRNVIHLDLKPENLILQSNDPLHAGHEPKVKLVDFGMACKLDPHEICKISADAPDYSAPEILEKDTVGFYTDMWAVGVLAYVLLSGHPPFDSQADIKSGNWNFDGSPFDKVSQEAKDFIEKLLIKKKEKRMTAHECLEHPWLSQPGDEELRKKRREPLNDSNAYRLERDKMRKRYLDWWQKSIVPIGHISNYGPLRKLYADRYKIHELLVDRRELAPRFVIKPQSTFAYEGQSAEFRCLIASSDAPVIVSWYKDSKELKQSVKFMKRYTLDNNNNVTFTVNRCKMNDFGEYVIRAENHLGYREEPVFLDVRKRPVDFTPIHLEPMRRRREPEPPKFEEEPDCPPKFNFLLRPRVIQAGQSVKLLCCLKGKPVPQITWLKDNRELSKRDYTMTQADGVASLEITSCDTSHTAKYTCRAENALGTDETTADLLVEGKRTFTPVPMTGLYQSPHEYTGRHQRSLSLTRDTTPTSLPLPPLGRATSPAPSFGRQNGPLSATLYSANFSINTNRYLRRSYKIDPMAPPALSRSRMSRIPRSTLGSRLHFRTLSTYGRSSSSLQ